MDRSVGRWPGPLTGRASGEWPKLVLGDSLSLYYTLAFIHDLSACEMLFDISQLPPLDNCQILLNGSIRVVIA